MAQTIGHSQIWWVLSLSFLTFKKVRATPLKLTLKKVCVLNSFLIFRSFSTHLVIIFSYCIYKKNFFNHHFASSMSMTEVIGAN